jgi:hypothetical protein
MPSARPRRIAIPSRGDAARPAKAKLTPFGRATSSRGDAARPAKAKLTLFGRWVLLVYVPLGLLTLGLLLLVLGVLSGAAVWLLLLLGVYCVVPVLLLLEWRRRGLPLPTPRGVVTPRPSRPAAPVPPAPPPGPVSRLSGSQRAMVGIAAIAALLLFGVILLVFGMGRLDSSLGLLLAAIGGFLMILSVTVPTFRLFDIVLRAVGRLIGRKAGISAAPAKQAGRRRPSERRPTKAAGRRAPQARPRTRSRDEPGRIIPPEL